MKYEHVHFGKGIFRSKIAHKINSRGRSAEINLELILHKRFGEVFVHTEKMFGKTKNRVDFYIYTPSGNFGVDIFYPGTIKSMQNNVNIKVPKYRNFSANLYLTVANQKITQKDIDEYIKTKKNPLPENIKLIALGTLLNNLNKMRTYKDPCAKNTG